MIRSIIFFAFLVTVEYAAGQDSTIERTKIHGVEMDLFQNTVSMSQALAINNHGSVVGTREVLEERGPATALRTISFYHGSHGTKDIPIPETFTSFESVGISDTDIVVGYATRPLKHQDGSLRGIAWDSKTEQFFVLPVAEGDKINQAQGISADGKRITGYTTGPERLRPALWEFDDSTQQWKIIILPTIHDHNPYLMSGHLVISPDGRRIAGCCTEELRSDGVIDNSLFLWTEKRKGEWERTRISTEYMYLGGINNRGEMVGSLYGEKGGRLPCYISPEGKIVKLELLPGDVSGEAKGINHQAVIVGFSDDPIGKEGGPELCLWSKDGKARKFGGSAPCYGAILGINDSGQMSGMIEYSPVPAPGSPAAEAEGLLLAFRTAQ